MRDLSLAITQTPSIKRKSGNPSVVLRWNVAIVSSILILGLTYLFQINALGTKGYQIRTLEQKIKQLEVSHKQLEVQSSSLKSITRIQAAAETKNFVPVAQVEYIKDGDVALK